MAHKLTKAQVRCLNWYEQHQHLAPRDRPHTRSTGWDTRQLNRLLDLEMLHVGPGGWHVPTDAGREALRRATPSPDTTGAKHG